MKKYRCIVCSFTYDPEKGDPLNGIAPGTPFEDIPDTWRCPHCGVSLEDFKRMAVSA
jgi:rubredoxin